MGTPEFAVESLKCLVENDYNVVAVVTQPDKPVGRHGSTLQPSQVKIYAQEKNIPVLQPEKMKDPYFVGQLASYNADLQVVVAFRMLPEVVWAMPRFGTFNVHAALLPQYRGAAPINWAVINGETETGVTTFFLDKDIDTGRIIMQEKFPIPDDADVEYVYDGLMHLGAKVAMQTIDKLVAGEGKIESIPQLEVTEMKQAPKIFKETCRIDWNMPAKKIYDFVRGLSPYPGCWTIIKDHDNVETVLKIFRSEKTGKISTEAPGTIMMEHKHLYVAAKDEWLELMEVQLAGKKRMSATDFMNGCKNIEEFLVVNK